MEDKEADWVMTIPEVAAYLRVGETTIYRLARRGDLPAAKIGGQWRFSRRVIERFLAKRHKAGTTAAVLLLQSGGEGEAAGVVMGANDEDEQGKKVIAS